MYELTVTTHWDVLSAVHLWRAWLCSVYLFTRWFISRSFTSDILVHISFYQPLIPILNTLFYYEHQRLTPQKNWRSCYWRDKVYRQNTSKQGATHLKCFTWLLNGQSLHSSKIYPHLSPHNMAIYSRDIPVQAGWVIVSASAYTLSLLPITMLS